MYDISTDVQFHHLENRVPKPGFVEDQGARRNVRKVFILSLLFCDVLMMYLGFQLAYFIRFGLDVPFFVLRVTPSFAYYQLIHIGFIFVLLILYYVNGLYSWNNLLGGYQEYSLVFNATSVGMLLIITTGFIIPELIFARGWLIAAWITIFLFVSLARFFLRRVAYVLRRHGYFLKKAVVVGANEEGKMLAQQLSHWHSSGFLIAGFVDQKLASGENVVGDLTCLGNADNLDQIIKEHSVEEIILASSAFSSRDNMLDIFKSYGLKNGTKVRFSSGLYEIITTGMTIKNACSVPLVEIDPVRLKGIDKTMKTLLEYSLVIPGVILALPFMLIIALAIKLDSPGGVIYRRRVLGVNGQQFDAYKFRTMHTNGDEILENHPQLKIELAENHKLKNDPRITRVGCFLRKYSLDELPQLINVLKGEMALVGPRMISPCELEMYEKWNMNLMTVRPGITGLWQVSGRSDTSYQDRVRKDMFYIRNWNIFLDLQIIIQTIPVMLKAKGAY